MKNVTKKCWVLSAVVVGLTALGALSQVSFGQGAPSPRIDEGRYRLTVVGSRDDSNPYIFLLDTKTGRCWKKPRPIDNWVEDTPPGLPSN